MISWTLVEKLTLNGEYNVGRPYAKCYRYDYPPPVPNSEAGGVRECLIREYGRIAE